MEDCMDVWDFLRENWSQFTFLLLGVGYIVKVIIASTYKKREIKYSLIYQQQIEVVKSCLTSYSDAKQMFYEIPYRKIIKHEISADEIDNIVQPVLRKVRVLSELLRLFYGDELHSKFNEVRYGIQKVDARLSQLYLDESELTSSEKSNDFVAYRDLVFLENDKNVAAFIRSVDKALKPRIQSKISLKSLAI